MMPPYNNAKKQSLLTEIPWHSLPLGDVFLRLNSKRDGMSTVEAEKRLQKVGLNKISYKKTKFLWQIFLRQLVSPFVLILIFCAGVTFYLNNEKDSIVILIVAFISGLVGFFKEYSVRKILESLKKSETQNSLVLRDGNYVFLPSFDVVPGDIIFIKLGDKIPADARIINSFNLKTNESILTCGLKEVDKLSYILPINTNIAQKTNIVFAGTTVIDGSGEAVVFGIGDNSEIGKINNLSKRTIINRTPFEKKVYRLNQYIGLGVILFSLLAFLLSYFLVWDIKNTFLIVVVMAIAIIPESLFRAVTIILIIGARRILKEGCLVKNLAAVEILGRTSVILTDKTGILTEGNIYISKILTPEKRGGILEMDSTPEYLANRNLSLSYGLLASEVVIENLDKEPTEWILKGSAIDKALVCEALKAGLDFKKLNKSFKKLGQVYFNSQRKFGISFRENESGEVWAIIVGAADVLLSHIKRIQVLNRYESISTFEVATIKDSIDALARSGHSVLAVCSKKIENKNTLQNKDMETILQNTVFQLNLVGLIGLKDGIKNNIKDSVFLCHSAGIRTVMVTGDHTATARLVAKEINFFSKSKKNPEVLEGKDLNLIDTKDFNQRVKDIDIFSRIIPEQKNKIVEAWQSQSNTVLAIGEGVNDTSFIYKASIGISLASGTDSAREVSSVILLENSFSSLIRAIKESRVVLENIKKVTAYLLSISLIEIVLISFSLIFKLPLLITVVQILWVNLIGVLPSLIALSLDMAEKDIMTFKPQETKKSILDSFAKFLVLIIGLTSTGMLMGLFLFFGYSFESYNYASSIVFAGFGVIAIFSAFSVKSFKKTFWEVSFFANKYFLASVLASLLVLIIAIYLPPLSRFLGLQAIGFLEWVVIICAGIVNLILIELSKWIFMHKRGLLK